MKRSEPLRDLLESIAYGYTGESIDIVFSAQPRIDTDGETIFVWSNPGDVLDVDLHGAREFRVIRDTVNHEAAHYRWSDLESKASFAKRHEDDDPTGGKIAGQISNILEDAYIDSRRLSERPGLRVPRADFVESQLSTETDISEMDDSQAAFVGLHQIGLSGRAVGYKNASERVRDFLARASEYVDAVKRSDDPDERMAIYEKAFTDYNETFLPDPDDIPDDLLDHAERGRAGAPDESDISDSEPADIDPSNLPEDIDFEIDPDADPSDADATIDADELPDDVREELEDELEDAAGDAAGDASEDGCPDSGDEDESEGGSGAGEDGSEGEGPDENDESGPESGSSPEDDSSDSDGEGDDERHGSADESGEESDSDDGAPDGSGGSGAGPPGESEPWEDAKEELDDRDDRDDSREHHGVDPDTDLDDVSESDQRRHDRIREEVEKRSETEVGREMRNRDEASDNNRWRRADNDTSSDEIRRIIEREGLDREIASAFSRFKTADVEYASEDGDYGFDAENIVAHKSGDYSETRVYRTREVGALGGRLIGIALDRSGSMDDDYSGHLGNGAIVDAKVALGSIHLAAETMDDEICVRAFGKGSTELVTAPEESFEWDHLDSIKANGNTPTADGVRTTTDMMADAHAREKVLVVITDGKPSASAHRKYEESNKYSAVAGRVERAREMGIKVIGIGVGSGIDESGLSRMFGDDYVKSRSETLVEDLVRIYRNQLDIGASQTRRI